MSIDIISQHTNTLPSGFKINFTVGRIVKDKPNSLSSTPPAMTKPARSQPSQPAGTPSKGAA